MKSVKHERSYERKCFTFLGGGDLFLLNTLCKLLLVHKSENVSSPVRHALRKRLVLNFNRCSSEQKPIENH